MGEKVGKDIIKQKRKLKEKLEKVNQIQVQMKTLEELGKRKMTSQELQEFVESLGGHYYLILPKLKESGLLNIERDGWHYFYSLNK